MPSHGRDMEGSREEVQFDDALNYLLTDGGVKKMHGNVRLSLALDSVERSAREHGLTGDVINTVVDIITQCSLSITAINRLIKSLLPCDLVPVNAVLKCVSWLCTMKPSTSVQSWLIRWMVLTYDLIDDKDMFHAVYTVFFHFLQYESMCPHVCHLLYLMTRKNDVKVFRVRALLKLQERMGVQPYILGLLSLYKIYCPHLVTLSIPKRKKVFFPRTDACWQVALLKVQHPQAECGQTNLNTATGSPGTYFRMAAKTKRRRHELIPTVDVVTTSDEMTTKPGLLSQQMDALVPFSQIRSFTHLLSNLDRLELPSQMAAVLTDRNLQHVLRCHPDTAICTRLVFWLDHALTHELLNDADGETERGEQLLMMLIAVSDFLKEGLPVCELFLERFLHMWNGRDYRVYILKLITRCRLRPFTALNELLLEPLRRLMFCSSVFVKCQILICFTDLLRNFVSVEYPRYKSSENSQAVDESDHFSVFSDKDALSGELFHPLDTVTSFIEFVDCVCVMALRQEREHALLHHCVLTFFELVSSMYQAYDIPVAPVLSRELFYRCLFCDHATILMRLCDVMCSYRNAYQAIRHLKTSSVSSNCLIDHIKTFNLYIVDMCDTLWRSRAFNGSDKHPQSVFHLLQPIPANRQVSAKHSFSLSQHPAMLGLAARFLAEMFPDMTNVQPKLIRQNIDAYLEYLETCHMPGMMNFVKLFIQRHSASQSTLNTSVRS